MSKVLYRQGTKATYLGIISKNPNALYFCTDTKELFRGEDLYSDGLRLVDSFSALPSFLVAADGILYFCKDNGCGYVLNEFRDAWIPVIRGVDDVTIGLNDSGLMSVKSVPIQTVVGLEEKLSQIEEKILSAGSSLKPSDEFIISEDGIMSIQAVEQHKITGLEERLHSIEQSVVGGIRYCGGVDNFEDLPTDAEIGHLYEVYADNSEWCWNGEKWFEYGKSVSALDASEVISEALLVMPNVKYEFYNKPAHMLVNEFDHEFRVMCPKDMPWEKQAVGATGDANNYYVEFRAYAPSDDVVSFKEDFGDFIEDQTMHFFDDEFAGVDKYGRKYSIVWLALAHYDEMTDTWTYYGDNSNSERCVGWTYNVEWYNADGIKVACDSIRINLTNDEIHVTATPHYVTQIENRIVALEESYSWGDM